MATFRVWTNPDAPKRIRKKVLVDLRLLIRQYCTFCTYRWQAPSEGACPKCHVPQSQVVVEDIGYCTSPFQR